MVKLNTGSEYRAASRQLSTETLKSRYSGLTGDTLKNRLAFCGLELDILDATSAPGMPPTSTELAAQKMLRSAEKRFKLNNMNAEPPPPLSNKIGTTKARMVLTRVYETEKIENYPQELYRDTKFIDELGFCRTEVPTPQENAVRRSNELSVSSSDRVVLKASGEFKSKGGILSGFFAPGHVDNYRPLHDSTVRFLRGTLIGNENEFIDIFLNSSDVVMEDLRKMITPGPAFSLPVLDRIVRSCLDKLSNGVASDAQSRRVFEGLSEIFAHAILNFDMKPQAFLMIFKRHYVASRIHTAPDLHQQHPDCGPYKNFADFLASALSFAENKSVDSAGFPLHLDVEREIYKGAVLTAAIAKGAYLAAAHVDKVNEDHQRRVAMAISVTFAVVGAVLAGVPFGVASGVPQLLGPAKDWLVSLETKNYTPGVITQEITRLIDKTFMLALEGAVVPGLKTKKKYQSIGGDDTMKNLQKMRKECGKSYVGFTKDLLGSIYGGGFSPRLFQLTE